MHSVKVIIVFVVVTLLMSAIARAEEKAGAPAPGRIVTVAPASKNAGTVAPAVFPTNAPSFAQMNAEFMRKVMEASARIEAMKKEVTERENEIYRTNPKIEALQVQMIDIQKAINSILDADKELADLKIKRDILWTTMPSLPKRNDRVFPPKVIRAR